MAYLSAISEFSGTSTRLASVSRQEETMVTLLRQDGFRSLRISNVGILEMMEDSVNSCLRTTSVSPEDVDAVVFCTESFGQSSGDSMATNVQKKLRDGIQNSLLDECGLINASIFGTWMWSCSNLSASLNFASSLVNSGAYKNVLCIITERVPDGRSRLMRSGIGALSDVSVCCMITEKENKFFIQNIATQPATKAFKASNNLLRGKAMLDDVSRFRNSAEHRFGRSFDSFETVLADNFQSTFYEMLKDPLKMDVSAIQTPTKAKWGHAFSADGLLSLRKLNSTFDHNSGKSILMLNLGPVMLGAIKIVL